MNVTDFRETIAANPDCSLRVAFANGPTLPEHFHITEVGRVEKDFVDCGGVRRTEVRCVLQTLVAGDFDHRLSSTRLAGILALIDKLNMPPESSVEVEHQERSVSIDEVDRIEREGETLTIYLSPKQTTCLAEDACGIQPGLPQLETLDGCCDGPGCC